MIPRLERTRCSRGRRASSLILAFGFLAAACGEKECPVTQIAPLSSAPPITAALPIETTTTTPPDPCEPMPTSDVVLNIETDLTDEQIKYFVCGINIAVREVESFPPTINLALFNDKEELISTIGKFLPNSSFRGSPADEVAHAGLFDKGVIFWDYARSIGWADDPAFAFRVGAHEMFHAVESYLSVSGYAEEKPAWLNEGAAEYFAMKLLEKYGFTEHLEEQRKDAEQFKRGFTAIGLLAWWESRGPYSGGFPQMNYPAMAEIVGGLVARSSEQALLVDYWRERNSGESWLDTFERVFGISVQNFYEAVDAEWG